MAKVLNSFKSVPDLDKMPAADWAAGAESGQIDTSYLKNIINCYDESALELTLRFYDKAVSEGFDCFLGAVTSGGKIAEKTLKTLAALGFNKTDRIICEEDRSFEPELTASALTEYAEANGPWDMIVMGVQSADGCNKKTPYLVAESLNMPCISQVISFVPEGDKACRVTYMRDGAQCEEVFDMPVLLAVGDVPSTYLRVPTLKRRMETMKQDIGQYEASWTSEPGEARLQKVALIDQTRAGVLIEGEDSAEKAKILYDEYLKGVMN
jgi:electron transfer flavoprotein beta subunit